MWRENGDQWRIGRTNDYYYVCNEENPLQVWTSPGKTWPRWGNVRPFKVIIISNIVTEYFTNLIELIMKPTPYESLRRC